MAAKLGANEIIAQIIQLALEKLETIDHQVSSLCYSNVSTTVNKYIYFFWIYPFFFLLKMFSGD